MAYNGKTILAIIPARAGSKGIPGKNVIPLCGKPLLAYSIEHAFDSKYIDRVLVSTDGSDIAAIARKYGAEVPFVRPSELATDEAGTIDVLLHAMKYVADEGWPFDIVVLLHVTTPLRKPEDIDACIELLHSENADSVFSVAHAYRNPYFNMVELDERGNPRLVKMGSYVTRQSAPPVYDMNASIYVWQREALEQRPAVIQPRSRVYVMPRERSVDIDDEFDLWIAQQLLCRDSSSDVDLETGANSHDLKR